MIPINNSDTAWLIVSDFNQDNGKFYEDLREDILNPDVNQWEWEYRFIGPLTLGVCNVGNIYTSADIGNNSAGHVGDNQENAVGGSENAFGVGGFYHDSN